VQLPEAVDEVGVRDLVGVEDDLDRLGVPGPAAAHLLVGRAFGMTARVADAHVSDAGRVAEVDLDAPEASGREGRGLRPLAHAFSSSSEHELMQ
jgi:hypothetical protein